MTTNRGGRPSNAERVANAKREALVAALAVLRDKKVSAAVKIQAATLVSALAPTAPEDPGRDVAADLVARLDDLARKVEDLEGEPAATP